MKRLGENVFQFPYRKGLTFKELSIIFWGLIVFPIGIGALLESVIAGVILFIIVLYLFITTFRTDAAGVILDNDRGIITLHKWTWNPLSKTNFEEIQMSEIMGVNRDSTTTTTTEYIQKEWQTSSTTSYNVVLQGKFGSKRFKLANLDDWNLFNTLLYGEG